MTIAGVIGAQYGSKIATPTYSKTWLVKWYQQTDFREIASMEYESDLKQGSTLRIRQKPTIAINDYTANADISFEMPTTTYVEMDIDQAKYFAVKEDKVETQQADMDNMNAWVEDGMKQLEKTVEADCYSLWYTDASAQNAGNTAGEDGAYALGTKAAPVAIDKDSITHYIGLHALTLDDNEVPEEDRNIVLPKWCRNAIVESPEFSPADVSGDAKTAIRDRYIGTVQGFKIYLSNNLFKETDGGAGSEIVWNIFSAHKSALQFAGQLEIEDAVDFEKTFGAGRKALFVYGRKGMLEDGITHGVIARA